MRRLGFNIFIVFIEAAKLVPLFYFSLGNCFADEVKNFFSKYGKVVEHEIIRDHVTRRSRGFGFIVFDNEQVVDHILVNGNMIDMEGTKVSSVLWIAKISDGHGHIFLCSNQQYNYKITLQLLFIVKHQLVKFCSINSYYYFKVNFWVF